MKYLWLLLFIPSLSMAAPHDNLEKYYQIPECDRIGGKPTYIVRTGTFADCYNGDVAVEVDFADKWAESIGQAMHYGIELKAHPVIWLIMENVNDCKHLPKLLPMADKYNVIVRQLGAYAGKCL